MNTDKIVIGSAADDGAGIIATGAGTRIITLTDLGFDLKQIQLAYVYNITQDLLYYAPAVGVAKATVAGTYPTKTITIDSSFAVLGGSDKIHIQAWSSGNLPVEIVTASSFICDADDTWKTHSYELDCTGAGEIAIWVKLSVYDSKTNKIQWVALTASGGQEYVFETEADYVKTLGDATISLIYKFTIDKLYPYLKFKTKATDLGLASAFLTGGTSAESDFAVWELIADGSFAITIDGTAYNIDGIDFDTDASMDDVAATIQAAIRIATGALETCTWSVDHFIITTTNNPLSAITVTSTSGGTVGTDISGVVGTWMDSDVGAADESVTARVGDAATIGIKITKS